MSRRHDDVDIYTQVSDTLYDDLNELCGQEIVHIQLWEDSMADSLEADEQGRGAAGNDDVRNDDALDDDELDDSLEQRMLFDLDLYLKDGIYFELLATICYPNLESEPLLGHENIDKMIQRFIKSGVGLAEVAVGQEDELILVLGHPQQAMLYLAVGGWVVNSWEELPI